MTTFSSVSELRGPSWLLEVMDDSPAARRVHRWWQWAALSLGCVSGCASWDQFADTAAQPLRSTGELMSRTGDRVGEMFDPRSTRHRNPANLPTNQSLTSHLAQQSPPRKVPMTSQTSQASATSTAASEPASQAIHKTTEATEPRHTPYSIPKAPPAVESQSSPGSVELLPAPSPFIQPISNSQLAAAKPSSPVTEKAATTEKTSAVATAASVKTWCRVRIRNISKQPVPQVAVTVVSPVNTPLVSKDGESVSATAAGKMEFAPVPQVAPSEEVILVIGLATDDPQSTRLRVQVRDGLGGSNQDVQARWQVAIEPLDVIAPLDK